MQSLFLLTAAAATASCLARSATDARQACIKRLKSSGSIV